MTAYTEKLHRELLSRLNELNKDYNPDNIIDPRLNEIMAVIKQIREELFHYRFQTDKEEIHYFKYVLPKTLVLYIYYSEKIEWERINRQGSSPRRYKFLDRIYSLTEGFRKEYGGLYEYYRDWKTDLDELYFLRSSPINRETKNGIGKIPDSYSPPFHSVLLATFIAYTRLENELKSIVAVNSEKTQN